MKLEPAFPYVVEGLEYSTGMTLRDYFAAKAIQGMLADPGVRDMDNFIKNGPRQAYAVADAMLEIRHQPQKDER